MGIKGKQAERKMAKVAKKKGKKLKIKDAYLEMKKVGAKVKAVKEKVVKKEQMNGDAKVAKVTGTQKKKNAVKNQAVNGTVTAKKKAGNKVNTKENVGPGDQVKTESLQGQTKTKKGKKKMAACKINQQEGIPKPGKKEHAKKRKRQREDNEAEETPKKRTKTERTMCSLLIHFPDSYKVTKMAQVKSIVGDSVVGIRFPEVPKGQSKGFCYAEFKTESESRQMKKMIEETEFEGKHFTVKHLADEPKPSKFDPKFRDSLRLFVGRLPKDIKMETIEGIFPTATKIRFAKSRKRSFRHAMVHFETEEEAKKAFEASKDREGEDQMVVNYAYLPYDKDLTASPAKEIKTEDDDGAESKDE